MIAAVRHCPCPLRKGLKLHITPQNRKMSSPLTTIKVGEKHDDPAVQRIDKDQLIGDYFSGRSKVCKEGEVPNYIIRAKSGKYHYFLSEPTVASNFLWYMSEPREISKSQLELEMQVPGRRWYATDKVTFMMMKQFNCSVTDGEPYVCLQTLKDSQTYWFGPRHEELPAEQPTVVMSVADLYLKSLSIQQRLFRHIVSAVRRVVGHLQVFRCGNTMIEIRQHYPTEEQMELLALIPGIAKFYKAAMPRLDDPRGEFIQDGAGGMPILRDQPALCLISGGIDSPVAAYKMMCRGCHITGVHFLNSTNETAAVIEKNRRLAKQLSRVQGYFEMHFVDISKLQSQIVANVPNQNRTLVYKWFMLSLGAALDEEQKFIVVGDSLGQVASQTIHNISTLYSTIPKAVIAPLIGTNKIEIIDTARKLGTFETSIIQAADCCQFMMCKTGANLWIGKRALRHCVSQVQMVELPITTEVFYDGKLLRSKEGVYLPNIGARAVDIAPSMADANGATGTGHNLVCFDSAAGTVTYSGVQNAMVSAPHGNPSSLHQGGRAARMAIEKVRSEFAAYIGVSASDIFFTSGGTEANNIALSGYRVAFREAWTHASTKGSPSDAADDTRPTIGILDLVNHETGSVHRVLKRPPGCSRLHVDACQALTKVDIKSLDLSEVDSMSFTAHKINGPVGCGILYLRDAKNAHPIMFGGSQEGGVRPGTENVPAIVGLGVALRLDRSHSAYRDIETFMVDELTSLGLVVNRRGETSGYIVHATLPEGFVNVDVVAQMSTEHNVEIGTGSACKTNEVNTTVYETLGIAPVPVKRSLRFSWDSFATMNEAEYVISSLKKTMKSLATKK